MNKLQEIELKNLESEKERLKRRIFFEDQKLEDKSKIASLSEQLHDIERRIKKIAFSFSGIVYYLKR